MLSVVGETVVDLVRDGDGRYTAHPGGSPLNVAVGLARLGHHATMLARFSTGSFGRLLREHAAGNGVDVSHAVDSRRAATLVAVTLDDTGSASYDFYTEGTADWHWTYEDLATPPLGTRVLHTGSVACYLDPGADHIAALFRACRASGDVLLSFDPNLRPRLLGDRAQVRRRTEEFVTLAHVVKASEEDLRWLHPGESPEAVARRWLGLGPDIVVITLGAAGAIAVIGQGELRHPAPRVEVVDTVGAGDAFTAGLLSGLVRRELATPRGVRGLAPAILGDLLDDAITVAAVTCTRPGADPPGRADLALRTVKEPKAATSTWRTNVDRRSSGML